MSIRALSIYTVVLAIALQTSSPVQALPQISLPTMRETLFIACGIVTGFIAYIAYSKYQNNSFRHSPAGNTCSSCLHELDCLVNDGKNYNKNKLEKSYWDSRFKYLNFVKLMIERRVIFDKENYPLKISDEKGLMQQILLLIYTPLINVLMI